MSRAYAALPVLTVSQAVGLLNEALALPPLTIEGEIRGYAQRQGRWAFFSLCDENTEAVIQCFAFTSAIPHPLEDGMRVVIVGSAGIYEKTGALRVTVRSITPQGDGTLRRAYELLKQKLDSEGLTAADRKRALPRIPKVVGIVSSPDAAGYGDFMRILADRIPCQLVLAKSAVQGERAVAEIVAAIDQLNEDVAPDCIVLIRGGGSLEDLAAFNSEPVCRAIARSRAPVLTGVGHERDVTLADLVADVRAATPTNAAMIVLPTKSELAQEWMGVLRGMHSTMQRQLQYSQYGLRNAQQRTFSAMHRQLVQGREKLRAGYRTMLLVLLNQISRTRERLSALVVQVKNQLPSVVLARGFSLTTRNGALVRSISDVTIGDQLEITLQDGTLDVAVTQKHD